MGVKTNTVIVRWTLIALAIFAAQTAAYSAPDGYICKTLQALELQKDGQLVPHKGLNATYIGETFSVERATGRVIGGPFANSMYRQTTVLDRGSSANAYKHITVSHGPNIWFQVLVVSEIEAGPEKPFWGSEGTFFIYSGTCK